MSEALRLGKKASSFGKSRSGHAGTVEQNGDDGKAQFPLPPQFPWPRNLWAL
jgi:hypothetical protein